MAKRISTGFINDTVNGIKVNTSIKSHSGNYDNYTYRNISYIVMHYTGNKKDTAKANAKYFKSGDRNASAHFFVDNKNIYQIIELKDTAYHCGTKGSYYHDYCRNFNSIGIEMCCTAGNYKISSTTIKNGAHLCANMCKRLGISANEVDKYVLRHYDVTHKKCPAQMADSTNDIDWINFKNMVKKLLGASATITPPANCFLVKITAKSLNVRSAAGVSNKVNDTVKKNEVYTIVSTKKVDGCTWGKLKSGAGWINLYYTKKI